MGWTVLAQYAGTVPATAVTIILSSSSSRLPRGAVVALEYPGRVGTPGASVSSPAPRI